jgi:hypothetical protein
MKQVSIIKNVARLASPAAMLGNQPKKLLFTVLIWFWVSSFMEDAGSTLRFPT